MSKNIIFMSIIKVLCEKTFIRLHRKMFNFILSVYEKSS